MTHDLPPKGTRVEIIHMPNEPNPVPIGTRGTVTGGTPGSGYVGPAIYVEWDNGRRLNLLPDVDQFKVVAE